MGSPAPARPTDAVAVLGALAIMQVGTPGQIRAWLAAYGLELTPRGRVSQTLSRLAAHDPPLAEVVARDDTGKGTPGVWRLTAAGREARATRGGRLAPAGAVWRPAVFAVADPAAPGEVILPAGSAAPTPPWTVTTRVTRGPTDRETPP